MASTISGPETGGNVSLLTAFGVGAEIWWEYAPLLSSPGNVFRVQSHPGRTIGLWKAKASGPRTGAFAKSLVSKIHGLETGANVFLLTLRKS